VAEGTGLPQNAIDHIRELAMVQSTTMCPPTPFELTRVSIDIAPCNLDVITTR
jgi:hypothetical protein